MKETNAFSQNSFQMDFVNPILNEYGDDVAYSVIVTTKQSDPTANNKDLPYWADVKKSENTVFMYVAIENCNQLFAEGDACWQHDRKKRAAITTESTAAVTLTVGGDTTCDETTVGVCNDVPSPSITYYVKLRASSHVKAISPVLQQTRRAHSQILLFRKALLQAQANKKQNRWANLSSCCICYY